MLASHSNISKCNSIIWHTNLIVKQKKMFTFSVLIPILLPWCRMGKPQWRLCIHGRMVPKTYCVTLARMDMTGRTHLMSLSIWIDKFIVFNVIRGSVVWQSFLLGSWIFYYTVKSRHDVVNDDVNIKIYIAGQCLQVFFKFFYFYLTFESVSTPWHLFVLSLIKPTCLT